ncbi:hypothetical protein ACFYZ0_02515 [Streptomyces sp. NPDC001708]|uniref:hypothetical protein n=1 Tax=Streptomyces sp. NPDC001708 TaxID=3364602 RepID=UPI00369F5774
MARDRDGWEYVGGVPRWAPTVEVQLASILDGTYGDEYVEKRRELDDLVRAAQRDAAEKLFREARSADFLGGLEVCEGVLRAADLTFPNYPKGSDSE